MVPVLNWRVLVAIIVTPRERNWASHIRILSHWPSAFAIVAQLCMAHQF